MSGKGNDAYEKLDREITAKYGHLYQRMNPDPPPRDFALTTEDERERQARTQQADRIGPDQACGWWVGPVWKLDGETCVCKLSAGHPMPHECTCGSWFEGCGQGPDQERCDQYERNDQ